MCSNYKPVRQEIIETLGRGHADFIYPDECWPGYDAPFFPNFEGAFWLAGTFGLLPHWATPALARQTYNARSEKVAEKSSFRNAWKKRQLAIIPVEAFFEPNYESGKPVRWRIGRRDGQPIGLAGIWERRPFNGGSAWSFSMLTINADHHPLMSQFHKPGKEKRSVVPLDREDWDAWLCAGSEAEVRSFLQPFEPELLVAQPDPRPFKAAAGGCCRRRKSVEIWRHKTAAEFGVDRLTHKGPGGPLVIYGRWGQKGGSFSGGSLRVMRSSRYRSSKAIS